MRFASVTCQVIQLPMVIFERISPKGGKAQHCHRNRHSKKRASESTETGAHWFPGMSRSSSYGPPWGKTLAIRDLGNRRSVIDRYLYEPHPASSAELLPSFT